MSIFCKSYSNIPLQYDFYITTISMLCRNRNNVSDLNIFFIYFLFIRPKGVKEGTAVAEWLRCCATNRKVAGSIPDGVIGIFH